DRVACQMGVGHMALLSLDSQPPGQRAAASILYCITQGIDTGRFTHNTVVRKFCAFGKGVAYFYCSVYGRAFLIRGDQQRYGAAMVRMSGDELFHRHHESSDRSLHISRTTTVKPSVTLRRDEGRAVPMFGRPGWHHIGMAGKH